MTTLSEVKDEVAQLHGYDDWYQIDITDNCQCEKAETKAMMLDDVAKLYAKYVAEEALKDAAENAEVKDVYFKNSIGYDTVIDKQSILNTIIKLP